MADRVEIARKAIYDLGKPISSTAVEALLKEFSSVPTEVFVFIIISCSERAD
jgi:hypothetical protein